MSAAFFLDMSWKSALIAGAALMLAFALRSRAPADRALVLRIGVIMLLALPAIALLVPSLQVEAWSAPELPAPAAAPVSAEPAASYAVSAWAAPAPETTIWDDPTPLVILAYLGGLAMAAARLLGGLFTLHRWTRTAREVTCPEWLAAFERVRWASPKAEKLRLLVADLVPAPLGWGWRRPVILIDRDTLDHPEEAEAILAHEVAHVARGDWPALLMSRVAAALFWFNPLVWLLEREVVQQAEEAADCEAIDRVEPARYAQTLLSWAQASSEALPANSIAPASTALGRRVRAILDGSVRQRPSGSGWTALAMILCIGFAAPVAAVELVEAAPEPLPIVSAATAVPPAPTPAVAPHPAASPLPAPAAPSEMIVVAQALPSAELPPAAEPPAPMAAPVPVAPPAIPHPAPLPQPMPAPRALVPVESLVAMRIHGVDADYVADLAALGGAYARLSVDDMIEMRVQGVTARFVRDMMNLGYRHITPDQLVALRVHGVTARQGRRAIEKNGGLPSVDRLVEMAIHGEI